MSVLFKKHTKEELAAAAAVEGVEVKSKDTKAEIAAKLEDKIGEHAERPFSPHAHPGNHGERILGNIQRRSDEDAILGSWVDVVNGEHAGRFGHFFDVAKSDSKGFPMDAMVRTRDKDSLVLVVPYSSLRPSERNGGR